ncbi:hypothetical protein [Tenacibaculum xiamenense]|uniref:hypothetical protein n=1 Tax=Tenacibaculum xiamenense TaxID=1261553 RepID=UPI0038966E6B
MAINYTTRNNPKKTDDKQELGFKIIFFALNFLLVPFSVLATYKGYKGFLGEYLAIVLAAATGLLFFGLNLIIMQRRQKGMSHTKQIFGFLLPLLISFFGNFAYFYGNQMEGTLLNKDLTAYETTLSRTYQDAVSELTNGTGLDELEAKLKAELELLKIQIEQKQYGGCGTECIKKWNEIIQLFRDYNTKYNNSQVTNLTKVYVKTYSNFELTALNYFKGLKSTKESEIKRKIGQLTPVYEPLKIVADSLLKQENKVQLKSGGVDLIKKIKGANDNIGAKAMGFLKGTNYSFTPLNEYEGVNAKNIKSVLESAFIKKDNTSATVFSIILSLVIDLATLGFVFLALSYNKQKRKANTGPKEL